MLTVRVPESEAALDSECVWVFIAEQIITHSGRREGVKGPWTIHSNKLQNVADRVCIKLTWVEKPGPNKHTTDCVVCSTELEQRI